MGNEHTGVRARGRRVELRFRFRGHRCHETLELEPTEAGLKKAAGLRDLIVEQIDADNFNYGEWFPNSPRAEKFSDSAPTGALISTALRGYLEWKEKEVEYSTFVGYRDAVENILIPKFGETALADLKLETVRAWCRKSSLTQKRLCNILTPLRHVMAEAASDGTIPVNPLSDLVVRKRKQIDGVRKRDYDRIDPFTDDELGKVLAELDEQCVNYAMCAVWSGLRPEELIALRWADVDFRKGLIDVRRAKTRGVEKGPKTKSSLRKVKLLGGAREALQAQRVHTFLMRDFVFHNPRTGEPWDVDKQYREWHWRPACKRAKVRYRPPAQLRHTYASRMLSSGENPAWLSKQMGHENTQITLTTYATLIADVDPNAGSKAEAMFAV